MSESVSETSDILWLVPEKPDNISTGRKRIAEGLRDRGHDVTLLDDRREHAREQYRNGFDVLMSTTAAGGLFGPPAKLLQGKAVVVDHVDPIRQMYMTSPRRTAALAQTLHAVSFRSADGILYVYDEEEERVTGHGATVQQTSLGVDYDRFAETPSSESLAHVEALLTDHDVEPGYGVYIGGLEPIYHIDQMLEAAERGGWPLVIAGTGYDDDRATEAADRCENITHLGIVDNEHVPALLHYAGAGICLVDDPHTVKVLEYCAAGLPVAHIAGQAMRTLPTEAVHWVPQLRDGRPDVDGITQAVRAAFDDGEHIDQLRAHATQHDYQRVIDQYDGMIREVTDGAADTQRRAVVQ